MVNRNIRSKNNDSNIKRIYINKIYKYIKIYKYVIHTQSYYNSLISIDKLIKILYLNYENLKNYQVNQNY